jgi:hypothetical protein
MIKATLILSLYVLVNTQQTPPLLPERFSVGYVEKASQGNQVAAWGSGFMYFDFALKKQAYLVAFETGTSFSIIDEVSQETHNVLTTTSTGNNPTCAEYPNSGPRFTQNIFQNATYTGQAVIEGITCDIWTLAVPNMTDIKMSGCFSVDNESLVELIVKSDTITDDYLMFDFKPSIEDENIFTLPSVCSAKKFKQQFNHPLFFKF